MMKKLESLRKKELIELITTIRPKADAYDRVCKELGIENDILGFVKKMNIQPVNNCECKNLPQGEIAISSKALTDPNWKD